MFVLPKQDNHIINRKKKRPLSKQECPNTPRCLKFSYSQHPNCLFPLFVGNLLTFPGLTESEKPSNFPPQFNKIAGVIDWPVPARSSRSLRAPCFLPGGPSEPQLCSAIVYFSPQPTPAPPHYTPALTLPGRPRPLAPRPLHLPNRVPKSLPQALKGDPALGTRPSSRPQNHPTPTPHRVLQWRARGRGPAPRASHSGVPG